MEDGSRKSEGERRKTEVTRDAMPCVFNKMTEVAVLVLLRNKFEC